MNAKNAARKPPAAAAEAHTCFRTSEKLNLTRWFPTRGYCYIGFNHYHGRRVVSSPRRRSVLIKRFRPDVMFGGGGGVQNYVISDSGEETYGERGPPKNKFIRFVKTLWLFIEQLPKSLDY